jgi:CheY-like chemotaxis protein
VKALPQVIPLVLVTGYQDTARAKAIGVDHVLPKPFSVVDLLRIARELTSGVQADAGFDGLPAYPPELAPDHRLDQSGF